MRLVNLLALGDDTLCASPQGIRGATPDEQIVMIMKGFVHARHVKRSSAESFEQAWRIRSGSPLCFARPDRMRLA
jgi:hypothetical protein